MSVEKHITMKQYNGTDYDILYPKTIAEQVEGVYSKSESSKAVRGTYPAAAGQSIAVGDVVDVVDGKIRKVVKAKGVTFNEYSAGFNVYDYCMLDGNSLVLAYWDQYYLILYLQRFTLTNDRLVAVGTAFEITGQTGTVYSNHGCTLLPLSSTSFFCAWNLRNEGYMRACVFTVSGDGMVKGDTTVFQLPTGDYWYYAMYSCMIRENVIAILSGHSGNAALSVTLCSISGTSVTELAYDGNSMVSGQDDYTPTAIQIDNNHLFVKVYQGSADNQNKYPIFHYLLTITDDNVISATLIETQKADKRYNYGFMEKISGYYVCFDVSASSVMANLYTYQNGTMTRIANTELPTIYNPAYANGITVSSAPNGNSGVLLVSTSNKNVYSIPFTISNNAIVLGEPAVQPYSYNIAFCKMTLLPPSIFVLGSNWTTLYNSTLSRAGDGWTNNIKIVSKDAIALTSAIAGQNCDVLFAGVAETSGLTVGTNITSDGVQGYVPQDGVLSAFPWWDYQRVATVTGSYTGDGAKTQNIDLGFQPRAVLVASSGGIMGYQSGGYPAVYGGLAMPGKSVTTRGGIALEVTETGFAVHTSSSSGYISTNVGGNTYYYIAFR